MKFSLFAACGFAVSVLALGGCAWMPNSSGTVSQKQPAGQSYNPYYQQNTANGQNTGASRPQTPYPQSPAFPPAPMPPLSAVTPAPQGKVKVAILLPLSGKNAALGQAMLNAAQQAVFDAAGTNFELQPHDTAADGGAAAAASAAAAGGVSLIIGPLFATDVPAAMAVAQAAGLQMLTLSTDTSLAQRGVYVMGLAPGAQVERVVAFAAAHGVKHFAALVPATPYGSLVGQTFQTSVAQNGGTVVDYETCDAPAAGPCIKNLAAQRAQIDGLFLPETGPDLKSVADQLTTAGFDAAHAHVLGTGLWDVPDLGRQSPLLVGGWYAAPDPAARRAFISNYAAAYGQEPPRVATLAYDATALAAVLAKRGAGYTEAALTNPNGFAGLDGIFRLGVTGAVERAMAVLEVTPDGAHVVDPSPSSFVAKR